MAFLDFVRDNPGVPVPEGKTNLDLLQQFIKYNVDNWEKLTLAHTHTQPFYSLLGFCPGLPG